jgi:methyltransferase (TIGR00027 family)
VGKALGIMPRVCRGQFLRGLSTENGIMRAGQPSQTAIRAAIMRAAHQVVDGEPRILEDPVALQLVEGLLREELATAADDFHAPAMRLQRATFVFRSRYAEDVLRDLTTVGTDRKGLRQDTGVSPEGRTVGQYVILGAGLETFAYRQPPWARGLHIFEVDHPATQEWKRDILEGADILVPGNVRFCPLDFETASLGQALGQVSFDRRTHAFFSWLGVTQYLTEAAITSTLEFVLSMPAGSEVVFSFKVPEPTLAHPDRRESAAIALRVAAAGEPWITRFEPVALRQRLLEMGFRSVYHLTPESADQRYFAGRHDGLSAPRDTHLMRALV